MLLRLAWIERGVGDGLNAVSDRGSMSSDAAAGDDILSGVPSGEPMSLALSTTRGLDSLEERVSTLPVEEVSDGNCGWRFGEWEECTLFLMSMFISCRFWVKPKPLLWGTAGFNTASWI